jgi:hypothetical protein
LYAAYEDNMLSTFYDLLIFIGSMCSCKSPPGGVRPANMREFNDRHHILVSLFLHHNENSVNF